MTKKNVCTDQERLIRSYMIPVYMHQGLTYVMMMRPSDKRYGGIEYQIAKGRIDPGETSVQAAIRECKEELGLLASDNIKSLGLYFGETSEVFYFIVNDCVTTEKPCYETIHTAWLSVDEFLRIGRPLHKQIIKDLMVALNNVCQDPLKAHTH